MGGALGDDHSMKIGACSADTDLIRIETPEEAARWQDAFSIAYREVFQGEPYFEEFSLEKAAGVFRMLVSIPDHITLLVVRDDQVVAFGVAVPLSSMKTVAPRLQGLVPIRRTYYLAELGVRPGWRGHGFGKELVRQRIRLMDAARYSHVVLRVAEGQSRSFEMYESLDFVDMGVTMDVVRPRTDGSMKTDRRVFLCRLLSQVDVD